MSSTPQDRSERERLAEAIRPFVQMAISMEFEHDGTPDAILVLSDQAAEAVGRTLLSEQSAESGREATLEKIAEWHERFAAACAATYPHWQDKDLHAHFIEALRATAPPEPDAGEAPDVEWCGCGSAMELQQVCENCGRRVAVVDAGEATEAARIVELARDFLDSPEDAAAIERVLNWLATRTTSPETGEDG